MGVGFCLCKKRTVVDRVTNTAFYRSVDSSDDADVNIGQSLSAWIGDLAAYHGLRLFAFSFGFFRDRFFFEVLIGFRFRLRNSRACRGERDREENNRHAQCRPPIDFRHDISPEVEQPGDALFQRAMMLEEADRGEVGGEGMDSFGKIEQRLRVLRPGGVQEDVVVADFLPGEGQLAVQEQPRADTARTARARSAATARRPNRAARRGRIRGAALRKAPRASCFSAGFSRASPPAGKCRPSAA